MPVILALKKENQKESSLGSLVRIYNIYIYTHTYMYIYINIIYIYNLFIAR